jgi:Shedu protein SduA, C-terminal
LSEEPPYDKPPSREMQNYVSDSSVRGGHRAAYEKAVLRRGPQIWRTAKLTHIFNPDSGEVKKKELRLEAWRAPREGHSPASRQPKYEWHCYDEEIELLLAFLSDSAYRAEGKYRLIEVDGDLGEIFELLTGADTDTGRLVSLVEQFTTVPGLAEALSKSDLASMVFQAVEIERRREQLNVLRRVVADRTKDEHAIHRELKGQAWIFGGKYVGEAVRRQLSTKSTVDIPLIRGDGSLHIVELKKATISDSKLIENYRAAGQVVGPEVNKGVGQLQNYLRDLDEKRATILTDYNLDCRRLSGTLLIGDSARVPGFSEKQVRETLRTYNSFLSRIDVMTYDELLESAERALSFDAGDKNAAVQDIPEPTEVPSWDDGEPPF